MIVATKRFILPLALALTVSVPASAFAQETENNTASIAEGIMALDGSAEAGTEAPTGWHTCDVVRTGAGWGNHYVALTCSSGPFTNKWHIINDAQKDAMLATSLAAATSGNKVQVYIQAASSGYNQIRALYLHK